MATGKPLESQVQALRQFSLLNQNDLRLVPYALVDGEWTLPEGFLLRFAIQMAEEAVLQKVFYDGSVKSTTDFVEHMQKPGNIPVFAFEYDEPVGVAWINGISGTMAYGHFAGLRGARGMTVEIGSMVLRYWMSWGLFRAILGVIPSVNVLAVRFIQRIGFRVLGEIPGVLYDAYRGEYMNASVAYYVE